MPRGVTPSQLLSAAAVTVSNALRNLFSIIQSIVEVMADLKGSMVGAGAMHHGDAAQC